MAAPEGNQYAKANSKYDESFNDIARKLCLLGHTDAELASFFDVCEATINNWKQEYPKFLESVKSGKELADADVADRLYRRAMGFEHDSEEIKIIDNEVARVPVRKIYPPDPTSAIFWLKNRQKDKWRDKQDITLAGDKDNPIQHEHTVDFKNMSDDELRQIATGGN